MVQNPLYPMVLHPTKLQAGVGSYILEDPGTRLRILKQMRSDGPPERVDVYRGDSNVVEGSMETTPRERAEWTRNVSQAITACGG